MELQHLLSQIGPYHLSGEGTPAVSGVHYDSRRLERGDVFAALVGARSDGSDYAAAAAARGAVAVLTEKPIKNLGVPHIVVPDARLALARAAAALYQHPSRQVGVVGITGTKGKTSTAFVLDSIFRTAGYVTALFSTVKNAVAGDEKPATLTTGEAPDVQKGLRAAVDAGAAFAVVEVSSHALSLRRVDAVDFAAAVFTNLSHDHLDFHGDMESYIRAKARLFDMVVPGGPKVINGDDLYGKRLALSAGGHVLTYGFGDDNSYRVKITDAGWGGAAFTLTRAGAAPLAIRSPLAARFNVPNAAAAAVVAHALGIPGEDIAAGVAQTPPIPGRLETLRLDGGTRVVVDYAHSPDSMEKALAAIKELEPTWLAVVFGCTGDRDRAKRPVMGGIAARFADFVVITNDDPYHEDAATIAAEIERGVRDAGVPYEVILDRAAAIRMALQNAPRAGGAVIAVLGKGHEQVMKIGNDAVPFSDAAAVTAAARELGLLSP